MKKLDELKTLNDNDEIEELFLCLPCAEKMKGMRTVKKLKVGQHQKKKGECEQCCRRRYGYKCKVVFNYDITTETEAII